MKKSLLFLIAALFARAGGAASTYAGADIYNVQNYSSSPFYSINGPYNQKFPTPVYVKGPSLSAAECQLAVNSAIWTQCSFRSNCANTALDEIRPAIMLELANRSDNNYTSCSGYIDGAFNQYRQQTAGAVMPANFPSATRPANYGVNAPPPNPYNYGTLTPYYEQAQDLRQMQLENMQRVTGGPVGLMPTAMPETFADLDFTERMDILREGWRDPAVNQKPTYMQLKVEDDTEKLTRQDNELKLKKEREDKLADLMRASNPDEWCDKYPDKCVADQKYQNGLKARDIEKWCKLNLDKCANDETYISHLKDTNPAEYERRYPLRVLMDKDKETLMKNWSIPEAEKFCEKWSNDPICPPILEAKRKKEEAEAATARADAEKARADAAAANARAAEAKARADEATARAKERADAAAEKDTGTSETTTATEDDEVTWFILGGS